MVDNTASAATSKRKKIMTGRLDVPQLAAAAGAASAWTEEMHSSFLNRIEAAFVHDFLFGWPTAGHRRLTSAAPTTETATLPCRLDRYVPDSAESTHDGHVDGAAAASVTRKRRRGWNPGRNGCTAGDISTLSDGAKTYSITKHHPHSGRRRDITDDADQVVPLFQAPETGGKVVSFASSSWCQD